MECYYQHWFYSPDTTILNVDVLKYWNFPATVPKTVTLNVKVEILEGDLPHDSNHDDGIGQGIKAM